MKFLVAAGLITFLAALPANAVDWSYISGESSRYYVDNDSIKTNGNNYIYTTRVVDFKSQHIRVSSVKISCPNVTFTVLGGSAFTMKGQLIFSAKIAPNKQEAKLILEDTVTSYIYKKLCQ